MRELRVRLLGGLDVDGMAGHDVGSRKARTLLAALALARGRPVSTDRLVEILWRDQLPTRPADQVGVLVSRLRGVLGPDRLPRQDAGYLLKADWLDVDELEARVTEAASRRTSAPAAARAAASAALTLVRGPLLPNEEGDWVETERAAIDRLVAQAHLLGADAALAAGDPMGAAAGAARALDVDPYDEAALRVLMRAHVAAGRPASALGAYARVRERLADELGASPDPATEALHTAIVRGEPEDGRAPRERPRTPVVGREPELAWLDDQLAQARARGGTGRVVVVEGEAGIGKTTLVRRWASSLTDTFVLVVACDELGRDLPLQPLLDGLDAHLGGLSDPEVDEVLRPQRRIVGPFLTRAAVAASPARHTELPDQASLRAALFAALLAVVERAAAGRPVVLVVDDAHLAGELTLAWLGFAARRGRHLLVVATRRPGDGRAVRHDASLRLGPLDVEAAEVLYGARRAAELHRRSRGHPLFLVALGDSDHSDDSGEGLPATITEAVERQVEGLGAAAPTLVAASVLGPPLDVALLADVLARPPAALLDDLETATTARILVERSRGFEFAHELVREALASSASAARRAFLHREAARALSSRTDREPLAVAHHARRGGDVELAARALVEAARVAGERSDHPGAVGLLDDAVALADGPAVRLARARARLAVQDLAGAADDAEAAIALGAGVGGFELAGWISYYRRDFDAALRFAEEGAARADDPALRASCLVLAGRVVHSNGDLAGADARLGEAAAIAPAALRPLVGIWLGDLRVFQGRWREAADQVDRALLDRNHLAHPFALPHALMTRLRAAAVGGRAGTALAVSAEALTTLDELGELGTRYVPAASNYRAWVLRHLGRGAEATELNERARALTASAGMEEPFNQGTLDLADGCLLAGDPDGAVAYLGQLRGLGPDGTGAGAATRAGGVEAPAMAWHQRERLALIQGRVALARGLPEEARELAAALAASAAERGSVRHARFGQAIEVLARLDLGEAPATSDLEDLLAQLDEVAGLEAWRVAAEVARRLPGEAFRHHAERRAAALLAATPAPDRPALERWMQPWLGTEIR